MNEHEFEDPAHDGIRRLLAEAAAPASIPTDVAATLDDTLAELVAQQGPVQAATADDRRSRRAPGRLLLAAAAVVVLGLGGLGVGQILANQDATLSTSAADQEAVAPGAAAPGSEFAAPDEPAAGGVAQAPAVPAPTSLSGPERDRLRRVTDLSSLSGMSFTAAGFEDQVTQVALGFSGSYADQSESGTPKNQQTPMAAAVGCAGPATVAGARSLPITFEGQPAVLVVNPVIDGSRYLAAWSCDGDELLASTTLR